jgi:serine/threonine protein kinase
VNQDLPTNDPDAEITKVTKLPEYAAAEVEEGAVLGDVRLVRLLDETSLYRDFEAINLLVDKPCVVRSFAPALPIGPVQRGRLSHALRRWTLLELPGVLPAYSVAVAPDGSTYAILGHHHGRSLQSLIIEHGALSRRAYLPIVRQICGTLIRAHAAKTPHLALDAREILLTGDRASELGVLLTGYGTHTVRPAPSEQIADLQRRPEEAFYLAPEQARGQEGDARSDVYALSALLYQMATGRPPFAGATFQDVVEKHIGETPRAPTELAGVSREFELTLLRGLEKDPRRRIPSAEALLASLDPASVTSERHVALSRTASREIQITPQAQATEPVLKPAGQQPRKKLLLFIILGVAVVACGGVIAWSLTGSGEDNTVKPVKRRRVVKRRGPRTTKIKRRASKPATPPRPKIPIQPKAPSKAPPSTPPIKAPPIKAPPSKAPPSRTARLSAPRTPTRIDRRLTQRVAIRPGVIKNSKGHGSIEASTSLNNARWFLDGRFVGAGQVRVLRRIPAGRHTIAIQQNGRTVRSKNIVLSPGQPMTIRF